ncbi:MAG: pilus assembly protein [Deltaproteobacteria bacterium]|nr:pilus assembly protein [Deltaproteobacteria bacterium]
MKEKLSGFLTVRRARELRDGNSERGVAMLELAITAPLLFLLALGVYDLSRMLIIHLSLTQFAREGVRLGSSMVLLEAGRFSLTGGNCYDYEYSSSCGFAPTQQDLLETIYERITSSVDPTDPTNPAKSPVPWVDRPTLSLESDYDFSADTLTFSISADYRGFLPPFDDRTIRVRASGPFL